MRCLNYYTITNQIKSKKQGCDLTRAFTKAVKITDAKGTLSFKKKKGTKKITINKTTGKITIKKGLKKGKYKITVDVTASGNDLYNPATKEVTFKVNVRQGISNIKRCTYPVQG